LLSNQAALLLLVLLLLPAVSLMLLGSATGMTAVTSTIRAL
jgi:hypothetical protein